MVGRGGSGEKVGQSQGGASIGEQEVGRWGRRVRRGGGVAELGRGQDRGTWLRRVRRGGGRAREVPG